MAKTATTYAWNVDALLMWQKNNAPQIDLQCINVPETGLEPTWLLTTRT